MLTNEWTTQIGFEWISHLLAYPDEDWTQTVSEVKEILPAISHPMADGIRKFLEVVDAFDPQQLWDHYVRTFDFGKKTNLYLTYADYGEERERGPALLELKKQYALAGFELNETQMPDYLPAVLEFCAHASVEAVDRMLIPYANRIAQLQEALERIESPYAQLLQAVGQGIEMVQLESKLVEEVGA
jgi:nitrate reductase delta subunit